jgi:putative copper resistance protein D
MTGTLLVLSILLSIATDAAYAVIVGTLLAGRWLAALESSPAQLAGVASTMRRGLSPRLEPKVLLLSMLVLVFAHLVRPWFLAASMSGSTSFHDNLVMVPAILSSTHEGTLWYVASAALTGLFFAITFNRSHPRLSLANSGALACLLLVAAVKSASGHAADEGDFTLLEVLQSVHILATALWSGSVLVSGLLVLPGLAADRGHAAVWSYTRSPSKYAAYAVLAVVVTGIYTSDRELDNTFAGLTTSTWGKVLIVKVVCVMLALTLGSIVRFRYLRTDATPARSNQLVRLIASEAIVMIVILCLSGVLGNHAPPMPNM